MARGIPAAALKARLRLDPSRPVAYIRWLLVAGLMLACSRAFADHSQDIEQRVKPLLEAKAIAGCVVGIFEDGRAEVHGYGEVHVGAGHKPDGNTIYEIGSVTKAFTGTLLADMSDRGLVKVDAPLQDFLPARVKLHLVKDRPILLVDLASHTSGLPRMPDNIRPKDPSNPYADYSGDQLLEFLGRHELRRPPGEYEYSNFGVGLLGFVLAKKAGQSYEQLVVDRIAGPLKMDDTRIMLSKEQRKRLAPPYNGELGAEKNWDFDALAGAGALRSTANDLLKFVEASLSDDDRPVVRAIHEAWKPRFGKPGQIGIGLGWQIARDGATRWHNGETGGYGSAIYVYAPKRLGVVVLCNTASELPAAVAEKTLQAAVGMSPEPIGVRKTVKVAPEVLKSYEGTYALSLFFAITVTVEDGKLMAQATGQQKCQIFPESETEFFYKVVDAQITFVKDKNGKVEKLILHQGGQDVTGIKAPAVEKPKK